ncbi:unnamed protein product, partial [Rotaria magnacalcarata]
ELAGTTGGGGAGGGIDIGGVGTRLERNEVANGGPLFDVIMERILPSDEAVPR